MYRLFAKVEKRFVILNFLSVFRFSIGEKKKNQWNEEKKLKISIDSVAILQSKFDSVQSKRNCPLVILIFQRMKLTVSCVQRVCMRIVCCMFFFWLINFVFSRRHYGCEWFWFEMRCVQHIVNRTIYRAIARLCVRHWTISCIFDCVYVCVCVCAFAIHLRYRDKYTLTYSVCRSVTIIVCSVHRLTAPKHDRLHAYVCCCSLIFLCTYSHGIDSSVIVVCERCRLRVAHIISNSIHWFSSIFHIETPNRLQIHWQSNLRFREEEIHEKKNQRNWWPFCHWRYNKISMSLLVLCSAFGV